MGSLLKNFAIGAGAGIAVGLCATASKRRAPGRESAPVSGGDVFRLEPLLDRLEKIEVQVQTDPARAELKRRIGDQDSEIASLRVRLDETERRGQENEASMQRLIAAIEKLVERTPPPSATVLPFEKHLAEAALAPPHERHGIRHYGNEENVRR